MLQLTRFYSSAEPAVLADLFADTFESLKAQISVEPLGESTDLTDSYEMFGEAAPVDTSAPRVGSRGTRIRVSMTDRRKCALKGEVRIERLELPDASSFVLFRRSKGSPLEWRRLFRDIARDQRIRPLIVCTT